MTAPTGKNVPIEELLPAIEKSLEAAPRHMKDLARELGCSEFAVRRRLLQLESEHRAHRVRENTQGLCYLWHPGPAPGAKIPIPIIPAQDLPGAELRVSAPYQSTVRSWPLITRRDELVAALFGLAQQSAA
ncbi:MAG: hypothetical protein ACRYF7_23080 [Janthinobacterium lividum]